MTDGIIQQIFSKWELKGIRENKYYQKVLDSVEQELIEKIKQEMSIIRDSCYMDEIYNEVCLKLLGIEDAENKDLIGDNQE